MPSTYYLDLIRELTRLNEAYQRTSHERAVLARLSERQIPIGEAVQKLFPHIGLKSQALLAIIHVANLVDMELVFEGAVNAMQDLAIAQHNASHVPHDEPFTTEASPFIPEVHIREVEQYYDELRGKQHARTQSKRLVSCHIQ